MPRTPNGPWYRASEKTWYATLGSKKISLRVRGRANRRAAEAAWRKLVTGERPTPPKVPITLGELSDAYERDHGSSLAPATVRLHREVLKAVRAGFGRRIAATLTPTEVERWASRPSGSNSSRRKHTAVLLTMFR